jgi:hypothetical protein
VHSPLAGARAAAAAAAGHRRAPTPVTSTPNHVHHPTLGEHVVDPEPSPGRERRRSRRNSSEPAALWSRDPIAWSQFFRGASVQNCNFNSIPNLLKLVKCVENRRKFRKMQTQFCWIRCEEYYNSCYTHIVRFFLA